MKEVTNGEGANVIYDPVGGDTFDRSRRRIAWEGRILVIGFASGRIADLPTNHPFIKNYSVVGVYIGEYGVRDRAFLERTHEDLMRLHEQGRIDPLIGADVDFDRVPQAIVDLSSRKTVGKLVVRVR